MDKTTNFNKIVDGARRIKRKTGDLENSQKQYSQEGNLDDVKEEDEDEEEKENQDDNEGENEQNNQNLRKKKVIKVKNFEKKTNTKGRKAKTVPKRNQAIKRKEPPFKEELESDFQTKPKDCGKNPNKT